MPELPEVESASRRLRRAIVGKEIARVDVLHRSFSRRLTPAQRRSLTGSVVRSVDRRGKHQLVTLDDGRILHAHFRMTGDWTIGRSADDLPRFARALVAFADGTRVVLDDPRALSTLVLHRRDDLPDLGLGPEPGDKSLTPSSLLAALAKKRGPIKPTLLDQRVIAGIGNIYAAEALWHARIAPTTRASSLTPRQSTALLRAIRLVIRRATGARYTDDSTARLAVYDREGKACRRCRGAIRRIVQAGRSTYYCPKCQP